MRTIEWIGLLSAAAMLWSAGALWAGDVAMSPRVVADGQVDCYSVQSILDSILRPGMTQREKAEAIYAFVRDCRYHWPAASDGVEQPVSFEYNVIYDPVKLANVYGYGYCFQSRGMQEALWQAAGLATRGAGIGGHAICECYYDGAWHYYDSEMMAHCLLPDGRTVASLDEISRDPIRLVLQQKHPSTPYFPSAANPLMPWESKVIVAGYFASRDNNYYSYAHRILGHRMNLTLAPGMRLVRWFSPKGAWNYRAGSMDIEAKMGFVDPAVGPKCSFDDRRYGDGCLLYQPDLTDAGDEYPAGVLRDRNMTRDREGLRPADPAKPAYAIFRIALPYVIVGWPTQWTGDSAKPVGAAVVSAEFDRGDKDAQSLSVSADGGATWTPVLANDAVGRSQAVADFSAAAVARYGYLLRVDLRAGGKDAAACRLRKLSVRTTFQCSPWALPAVRAGETKMTFKLGDPVRTEDWTPDLLTPEGFLRDLYAVKAIRFAKGRLQSTGDETGELVFELAPPMDVPGRVRGFRYTVGCRREPGVMDWRDDVKVYWAPDEPANWRLLADDDPPPFMEHWSYVLNGETVCPAGADAPRRVFVKVALRSHLSASVQYVHFYTDWSPDGDDASLPARGVRVVHAWSEGGQARRFEKILTSAPADYVVAAGGKPVNDYVLIEPVRDAKLAWREDDPKVVPPTIAPPNLLDARLHEHLKMMLAAIEADPAKGLPAAAKSDFTWLAGGARQAEQMFRDATRYPLPPDKPDSRHMRDAAALARIVDLLKAGDAAGGELAARLMAGPDTFAKLHLLSLCRAAGFKAPPDALVAGLADGSQWVRLATLELVRSAPTNAARTALRKMAADDPLSWLRIEAACALSAAGD
ncbi:MAG: hypothetical protein BIFFINMI_01512 [Phycisphaerae bacterium]|nr:hypothetical protein [Phycisphaerae bacterium]